MTERSGPAPDEPFLKRWSRRKRTPEESNTSDVEPEVSDSKVSVETGSHSALPMATDPGTDDPVADRDDNIPQEHDEEELLLSDEDMPPIDTLSKDSDVSCFFNKGVSEALRKKALRHLFMLPAFNIRDGLNDYDEDYTVFEPLGDTVTCDMKFHTARKAKIEEERRLELAANEEAMEGETSEQSEASATDKPDDNTDNSADADSRDETGDQDESADEEVRQASADPGQEDSGSENTEQASPEMANSHRVDREKIETSDDSKDQQESETASRETEIS